MIRSEEYHVASETPAVLMALVMVSALLITLRRLKGCSIRPFCLGFITRNCALTIMLMVAELEERFQLTTGTIQRGNSVNNDANSR